MKTPKPVVWLTAVASFLVAVNAALAGTGLLPPKIEAALATLSVIATVYLGVRAHNSVTPLAAPRTADGRRLIPMPAATDTSARP